MRVPHSEIKAALDREKRENAGKPKRGPKPKHSSASDIYAIKDVHSR